MKGLANPIPTAARPAFFKNSLRDQSMNRMTVSPLFRIYLSDGENPSPSGEAKIGEM